MDDIRNSKEAALAAVDPFVSLLAHDQYLREIRWRDHLTPEEEAVLLERLDRGRREQECPSPNAWRLRLARDARDRLLEEYQGMVIALARRLLPLFRSCELLDLVNEANVTLLRYMDSYWSNPHYRERPFSHFVSSLTYKAIFGMLREQDSLVKLSAKVDTLLNRKRQVSREWWVTFGREPSLSELAEALVISEETLLDLVAYARFLQIESIEALLINDNGVQDETLVFVSLYEAGESEKAALPRLKEPLQQAMNQVLTARQREVVTLRYRFDDQGSPVRSYQTIAHLLGCHHSNIVAIEQRARELLQDALLLEQTSLGPACHLKEEYLREYYIEREAVQVSKLPASTLRRRVHAGLIPCFYRHDKKVRLYPKHAIDALASSYPRPEDYYASEQAASIIGVSGASIRSFAKSGKLSGVLYNNKWFFLKEVVHAVARSRGASASVCEQEAGFYGPWERYNTRARIDERTK